MGAATGIGPYDRSQPVAHMSSFSFSAGIKGALFALQNQRLHAGGSHGIVGLQKLGRRRSRCQIRRGAPTSLRPGPHPMTAYSQSRPGRLVRFFFQSGGPWKGAQIYLSAEKKQLEESPVPRASQPSSPGLCHPAAVSRLRIYIFSPLLIAKSRE